MTLPDQSLPIVRTNLASEANQIGPSVEAAQTGVIAAQTRCDHLTGMAQQMCYASLYGINI
jgi:hypothetical protein